MGLKGQEFMLQVGELPKTGLWTTLDFLIEAIFVRELEDGAVYVEEMINIHDGIKAVAEALCSK